MKPRVERLPPAAPAARAPRPAGRAGARLTAPRRALAAAAPGAYRQHPLRVLPLLSQLLESQARVAAFENLAGRTAMVSIAAAAALESAMPGGLFATAGGADPGRAAGLAAAAAAAAVGLAGAAGAASARRAGAALLAPTLAALTSRTAAEGLQDLVEYVVDSVFSDAFMREARFPLDGDDEDDKAGQA